MIIDVPDDLEAGFAVVIGCMSGSFNPKDGKGEKIEYRKLYVLERNGGKSGSWLGYKVATYRVASAEVLEGLEVGDLVQIYFDKYGRVAALGVVS